MRKRTIFIFGVLLALFALIVRWNTGTTISSMERHLTAQAEQLSDDMWFLDPESTQRKLEHIIRTEELSEAEMLHRNKALFCSAKNTDLHLSQLAESLWHQGLLPINEAYITILRQGETIGYLHAQWPDHNLISHLYLLVLFSFIAAIAWFYVQLRDKHHLLTQTTTALKESEQQLREAHDKLEARIVERTAELQKAYEDLLHEINVRRKTEADLRNAKDAAEAANRAKDEFLANMSHEIRTPLHAIIGFASLLSDSRLDDRQRDWSAIIKERGDNLLSIINDILDLSKIEAEHLNLDVQPFSIRDLLSGICDSFAFQNKPKQISIGHKISIDVPDTVTGDPIRVKQILVNLISNAIKFTEAGEVLISVGREAAAPAGKPVTAPQLLFSVKDTGIGIPADMHDTIFRPFTQIDGSTTRKYGGTGLGLAICKRLVDLMGGRIWVESELGKGSDFKFTILLSMAEKSAR